MDVPQRIVCAAMKMDDGSIVLGVRHYDPNMREAFMSRRCANESTHVVEQGFIDNKRNFLTREEAFVVAKEQGQIIRRCGGDEKELFSENLY